MDNISKIQSITGTMPPDIGVILGSGMGHLLDLVQGHKIPYSDLLNFPISKVSGHKSELVIGELEGCRVLIFNGRSHYYEQGKADAMRTPLETFKKLGGKRIIITNAAGSLSSESLPGDLM